jgi:hypothetical protein
MEGPVAVGVVVELLEPVAVAVVAAVVTHDPA